MSLIPLPKAPFKIVQTFSSEDIRKLLETCQVLNDLWFRDMTLIVVMLDCGIRLSELVNLQIDDVNLTEGYLRIACGKGSKERVVPIGSVAQKMLWKYINHQRPQPITPKIKTLFLSSRGFSISRSGVEQMLTRLGERAKLSGVRCSPHTFRHSFAKNYLLNGADIFSLQKILGHSSLASVRNYVNLFAGDVKKQHQRFSPADNMAPDIKVLYSHLR